MHANSLINKRNISWHVHWRALITFIFTIYHRIETQFYIQNGDVIVIHTTIKSVASMVIYKILLLPLKQRIFYVMKMT